MQQMRDLLERLLAAGLPVSPEISDAMLAVDIQHFTDHDLIPFLHDRPVVFLETPTGGVKTISAPHMVVTLLHHLELQPGQEVLLLGAKGGYIAALISHIVGPEGRVTIVDPSREVVEHVRQRLKEHCDGRFTIRKMRSLTYAPPHLPEPLNRVLVTGSLVELPLWLEERVSEGGFVVAPLGHRNSQRLVKRERQGGWLDTDLGGVLFGPVDIAETEQEPTGAAQLANLLNEAADIGGEIGLFDEETQELLQQLAEQLRELPDGLPPVVLTGDEDVWEDEGGVTIDIDDLDFDDEHPLLRLLEESADWLLPLWPALVSLFDARMQHPGAPEGEEEDEEGQGFGSHDDLVP
jgi:protein-L-isoaspartate(D-aspartate) O-methyltransferase